MNKYNRTISAGLLAAAALLLAPARGSAYKMSEAEAQVIVDCRKNVARPDGELSPVTAKTCVEKFNADNGALIYKAKDDFPSIAVDVVAYNNALVDLKKLVSEHSRKALGDALAREMESQTCALCDLGLGPRPEKAFGWVEKYAEGRGDAVKTAVRAWDALGNVRTASLALEPWNFNKNSWSALSITDRYKKLSEWARKQTTVLVKAAKKARGKAQPDVSGLTQVLREDLVLDGDEAYQEQLDSLGAASGPALPEPESNVDKRSKEMAGASKEASALKGLSTEGQKGFLDKNFDNASASGGTDGVALNKGQAFKPVPITPEQADRLSQKMGTVKDGKFTGYIADEIKGTKSGDEIHAFFADKKYAADGTNALNLKFVKGEGDTKNALGWWSNYDKTTHVNTNLVDDYCAAHHITPEQMLNSEEHMKGVARYVAPNFVHETTHQRQDAWAHDNGLDFLKWQDPKTKKETSFQPYQMEMETEAFSMQAAFSAEKAQKMGPAYLEQISPSHKANAIKFMEDGVDPLRTDKHELYPNISSMEGSTAQEFKSARYYAQQLQALQKKQQADPASLSAADRENMKQYQQAMDSRFKWYTMVYQKSAADEKKLLDWRDSFGDSPSGAAVPGL
jgi:hypothetical protein